MRGFPSLDDCGEGCVIREPTNPGKPDAPTSVRVEKRTPIFEVHPLANIFPMLDGESVGFKALVADIKERGQQEPIVLYKGYLLDDKYTILDGRNRHRACQLLGIDVLVRYYTGDDPVGFVLSGEVVVLDPDFSPMDYLLARMRHPRTDRLTARDRLAIALLPFTAPKLAATAIIKGLGLSCSIREGHSAQQRS
jgi:hypothetical protein